MFGLGTPELLVIFAIAFLVFGGKKLPEIGAGLGKGIRSFKKGIHEVEDAGHEVIDGVPGVNEAGQFKKEISKILD